MSLMFDFIQHSRDSEHFFRTRPHRVDPNFLIALALNALLTTVIVGGGYSLAVSHGISKSSSAVLTDLGGTAIGIDQVRAQAQEHGVSFYWLGDEGVQNYSTEITNPERITLSYLKQIDGAALFTPSRLSVSVVTWPSADSYNRIGRGPIHSTQDIQTFNNRGDLLIYNRDDRTRVEVILAENSKVVVLTYPSPQEISELFADSGKIVLFR